MLRTGKRPDGTPIQVMPFESLGQLSDVDAQALHLFLTTPPGAHPAGVDAAAAGARSASPAAPAPAPVAPAPSVSSLSSGLRVPG